MTDEAPNKTERKLSRTGEKQTLQGVVGDVDADDLDVFGFEVIYTTGEFTVDRDALVGKCEELGLPDWMIPSQAMAHNAFGYAVKDLLEGREEVEWQGQRVRFSLASGGSRYEQHVRAEIYFPAEMLQGDEGKWIAVENDEGEQGLGVIRYQNPEEGEPYVSFRDIVTEDMSLYAAWAGEANDPLQGGLKQRMEALFERHWRQWNRGKDVNTMTYYLVDQWTDSIRLRDACYFVPANHLWTDRDGETRPVVDLVDAFADLYAWLDVHADKPTFAQDTHLDVIEIMDTDRQRKVVERRVDERLGDLAGDMAEQVLDLFEDDETIATISNEVADTLGEVQAVAGEYDDLLGGGQRVDLKRKNAVRRAMRNSVAQLDTDEAELVEAVLAEIEGAPSLRDEAEASA